MIKNHHNQSMFPETYKFELIECICGNGITLGWELRVTLGRGAVHTLKRYVNEPRNEVLEDDKVTALRAMEAYHNSLIAPEFEIKNLENDK